MAGPRAHDDRASVARTNTVFGSVLVLLLGMPALLAAVEHWTDDHHHFHPVGDLLRETGGGAFADGDALIAAVDEALDETAPALSDGMLVAVFRGDTRPRLHVHCTWTDNRQVTAALSRIREASRPRPPPAADAPPRR